MILIKTIVKPICVKYLPVLFCCLFLLPASAFGEKLPLKHLTTADGLPQNTVNSVYQDQKGFFWIGTNGGLARFDGYEFVNFTQEQGLPRSEVLDFLETRAGDFWLATKGGLVKFSPHGKIFNRTLTGAEAAQLTETPTFVTYGELNANNLIVTKLLQDSRGTIWVGTEKGLFQLRENANQFELPPINLNLPPNASAYVYAIYEDKNGAVWVGTNNDLFRFSPSGAVTAYHENEAVVFSAILADRAGGLWVGTQHRGLFRFAVDAAETPQITMQFASEIDSELEWIDKIVESANGNLWIGGKHGIYEFEPQTNNLFRYTRASGLGYYRFQTLFEDRAGDLWLGTQTSGVYRLANEGLISFETESRISSVRSVALDNEKNLLLTAFVTKTELDEQGSRVKREIAGKVVQAFEWRLGEFGANNFSWLIPKFGRTIAYYGWGSAQLSLQTRSGEWWIVTGQGLFRFPAVPFADLPNTAPQTVFDERSGLNPGDVFRIFEDSRGDILIATSGEKSNGFYRWERASQTLRDMSQTPGFADVKNDLISSFAEDARGNLWLGFYSQGFARIRDGKIDFWNDARGIPPGGVTSLFFDRENRLWMTLRQGGVLRIDNPNADQLEFFNYTESTGLSSNRTLSATEDKAGLIYLGTDRDVNRLNPLTGEIKLLNQGKNQLQREYRSAVCDERGTLWFGTTEGLVKYVPQPDKPPTPPEILILGVAVEGVSQNVSATGAAELALPTLDPQQNQVRIDYVSLSNFAEDNLNYQYKFAEDADWSPPNKERFVNFANLSAGNYQVLIRAVATGETVSVQPAVVSFRILPPIYLRPWFFALAFLLVSAAAYWLYHFRVNKLLEIERARTVIATDLHDDIGSNLSKIAVLSEVVRMRLHSDSAEPNRMLNSIAEIARESVSSMSDIVWAISPQRDSLFELISKMRYHAEEVLIAKQIAVKFVEPAVDARIKLPMELRRDFYLIFKEAINNIHKHSNCTRVEIVLAIEKNRIALTITDDGCGFDLSQPTKGSGLTNIRSRVAKLRGKFDCVSEIGRSTILKIEVPQT